MIFLTSYTWDFNIYHLFGDDVREPTLHLRGEYQAFAQWWGFMCVLIRYNVYWQ